MAPKAVVHTHLAPKPLAGIYSPAISVGNLVFCSGVVALDPQTGKMVEGDISARTHRCIQNIAALLQAAGTTLENAAKVNVYLTSMHDYAAMNEVYTLYWGPEKPCRTCVVVAELPRGTDVEIECIAALP